MNNTFRLKSILLIALLFFIKGLAFSQSQYMQEANSNGFFLKKVVSDTSINSGQNFTYTIYFSIPAGATAVNIIDALPTSLIYQGYTVTAPCGTMNVVSTPTVGNAGGTLQLAFPSVPSGCSGSIAITVNFPNGTTCNGEGARNRVCLNGRVNGTPVDLCTGFVSTTAKAIDPWHLNKYVLNTAYQGGSCPNVTLDSVITYRLYAWKNVGTTGQLNLANAFVYDTLPAGAVLTGTPSCGVNMTQSGNVITWNVGNLSALPAFNQAYCDFQVYYPRAIFPVGSLINNKGTMKGILGSPNKPCGNGFYPSNTTCVEIKPFASGTFSKTTYTNGQPGCAGYYWIQICNNGTLPINGFTVKDTLPLGISTPSVSAASGIVTSLSSGIVTATYAGILMPNQCLWVKIDFTIPLSATVGSTITNCATLTSLSLTNPIKSCTSFIVNAPAATACIWKEVCNKQTAYLPGQTFRYRLRVQNIGGTALTGASITDVLNSNLQYIGNPTYYSASTYNVPCSNPALPSGATAWTGLGFSQSGQNLTWTLPSIPAVCQTIFYGNCGQYGTWGVPFYFIEFDVKIKDTACLGNIPNFFAISGGNVTAQNSNTDYVNVNGTAAFNVDKTVSNNSGVTYSNSTSSAAGSNVRFKLKFTPASGSTAAMRHVTYVDLMPRDNGTSDFYILSRSANRGSAFDLQYQAGVSSAPVATTQYDALNVLDAKVNGITIPSVGVMFPYAGGIGVPTWTNGAPPANSKNINAYFGVAPIAAPSTAEAIFDAKIPVGTAAQLSSCNTFAANAAVCHLINSSLMTNIPMSPLESATACVTATPSVSNCCDSVKVQTIGTTLGKCCSRITATCDIKNIQVTLTNGTISGAAFLGTSAACYASTAPAIGQTTYNFNPISSACVGFDLQLCVNPSAAPVIIDYLITFADGKECRKFDTLDCDIIQQTDCCKETQVVSYDNVQKCCSQLITKCPVKMVTVNVLNGTLGNVTFAGATAGLYTGLTASTLTTANFAASSSPTGGIDMTTCPISANNGNPVYINYVIYFIDGTKCEKADTLKCSIQEPDCCEGIKITSSSSSAKCCSQITTSCPVKNVQVSVINGSLGNVSFAGVSASCFTGITGSSLTTANFPAACSSTAGLDMTICPNATTNPVIIKYVITFANGKKCEKSDTLKCPISQNDCIINACMGYMANGLTVNFNATGTTSNQPIVMYVWSFGDGQYATSTTPLVAHTYAANGTYNVCVTIYTLFNGNLCECTKTICKTVKVAQGATSTASCTSGLTNNGTLVGEIGKIVASPNPMTDQVHITLENATDIVSELGAEVRLMNLQGQVVFSKKLGIGEKDLDIQAVTLPSGLYVVALLKDGEVISTQKVVKQ